jgi:hypothetical protein
MEATLEIKPISNLQLWIGRILSGLIAAFLVVDGVGKVLRLDPYVEGTARVGYPDNTIVPLGIVLLACTLLYTYRRTALLGALLLTAYFGGATATHVRMGEPFVFPVAFGILTWVGIYLRDARLRALVRG